MKNEYGNAKHAIDNMVSSNMYNVHAHTNARWFREHTRTCDS